MSEESKTTDSQNEKITSAVKTKDPRRVEAGKRLGMISKQAKEKKLAQMREASAKQNKADVVKQVIGFLMCSLVHQLLALGSLD